MKTNPKALIRNELRQAAVKAAAASQTEFKFPDWPLELGDDAFNRLYADVNAGKTWVGYTVFETSEILKDFQIN